MRLLTVLLVALGAGGCSLVTVEQAPFTPMQITAKRPKGPPPRVVLMPSQIRITEKIQFGYNSAEIEEVSFSLLDEIAAVLVDNPQIETLHIEGHTDKRGSAAHNRKLSKSRATSVMTYLAEKKVAKARLVAIGHGPDQPIADGDDEAAHELNRRVEFKIVKQGPKKVLVEED
ncbi:MAG TPA: OmpA family protein [Kofleriaceae bacterium]|nr:OmpA family protein [Kofleriaceae bacterium]